jgi:hypothetical protein
MPRAKVAVKTGKRIGKLREDADKLSGLDKTLLDDLLVEYDSLSSMVDMLRRDVEVNGIMAPKEVGPAANPRIEMAERPEFTAFQKALKTKTDLAKKISDFAKRSDEEVEEDESESFFA